MWPLQDNHVKRESTLSALDCNLYYFLLVCATGDESVDRTCTLYTITQGFSLLNSQAWLSPTPAIGLMHLKSKSYTKCDKSHPGSLIIDASVVPFPSHVTSLWFMRSIVSSNTSANFPKSTSGLKSASLSHYCRPNKRYRPKPRAQNSRTTN